MRFQERPSLNVGRVPPSCHLNPRTPISIPSPRLPSPSHHLRVLPVCRFLKKCSFAPTRLVYLFLPYVGPARDWPGCRDRGATANIFLRNDVIPTFCTGGATLHNIEIYGPRSFSTGGVVLGGPRVEKSVARVLRAHTISDREREGEMPHFPPVGAAVHLSSVCLASFLLLRVSQAAEGLAVWAFLSVHLRRKASAYLSTKQARDSERKRQALLLRRSRNSGRLSF